MPSISVIIPALNAEPWIGASIGSLNEGRRAGLVGEVVVVDGGSRDGTGQGAAIAGAIVMTAPRGRGLQLAAGAASARGDWLLFLHADTRLETGWADCVGPQLGDPQRAFHFRFALDDASAAARRLERMVAWRCRRFALPYGDQGLLISRRLYNETGGFRPLPLMEDVDFVRRLGRARLAGLPVRAVTSADRWRRDGYVRRSLRNLVCLSLYFAGLPPAAIARIYA